jgi:8-oxo-dGTP pyrophosphatase MutT (NUDIX family)
LRNTPTILSTSYNAFVIHRDRIPTKVCPVVLRLRAGQTEILAFRHPLAGKQLIKGTIEPGEDHEVAALRELREESGINSARVVRHLGVWKSDHKGQIWTFYLCGADDLANEWTFRTEDDGGQDFEFFWQPIATEPSDEWHPVYRRAIEWLRNQPYLITS